jgi:DNA-binding LacI/PurR family transcriptional regulator
MVRLRDIAALTGVGVATVSKALRGSGEISPRTKERILEAARKLEYLPRSAAKGKGKRDVAGAIGVICPEIRSGYYAGIVTALESQIQGSGYGMMLGLTGFAYEREANLLEHFRKQHVAGVICITEQERIEYDLRTFRSVYGIPVVVVATVVAIEDFDYVKVNDDLGVRMAVRHLVELGHSGIGYIGDSASGHRMAVFADSLQQHGLPARKGFIWTGDERFELGGYLRMKDMLGQHERPSAVLAAYDDMAIGAMRAVHEAGLAVPADMSIAGIDGIEVGGYLSTSLTTVAGNTAEMAEAACRIIFRKIGNPLFTLVQHVEINPELLVRQSTGAPAKRAAGVL